MRPPIVYAMLTFVTYGIIHGVRICFSYQKISLQQPPLNFDTQFLGELDLTVLISLAISLKTLGWIGEKIGHKLFLNIGLIYLATVIIIIGVLETKQYNSHWVYILLYSLGGIASCTGWPSCLAIMSIYYPPKQNAFKLSLWNGCSQFGDFLALFSGYILIDKANYSSQSLLFTAAAGLIFMMILNYIFLDLPDAINNNSEQVEKSPQEKLSEQKTEQKKEVHSSDTEINKNHNSNKKYMTIKIEGHRPKSQVNFLNVWLLPSVASYVFCYGGLKAVNAIISLWLLFYLNSIGVNQYPKTIVISWSLSIFLGSILTGYYYNNRSINKMALIFGLIFSGVIFMYLGKEYGRNTDMHYLVLMVLSGLCFGGPFGMIGSTITLLLGKNPKIKSKNGALGAVISLMEGFGQFTGAFFALVVPILGLSRMFYLPSILCLVSAAILFREHRKQQKFNRQQELRRRQQQLQQQI